MGLCYNELSGIRFWQVLKPFEIEATWVTALVLLNVQRKHIQNVSQKLVDMPELSEFYSVDGRYDLVAIVRVQNNSQIADTITGKFSRLDGITSTETLIAFHTYSQHDFEKMISIGE